MADYKTTVTAEDFHKDTRAFFSGRHVAVTGGSGFIGSHLVEQLIALGAHPIVVSRRPQPPFLKRVQHQIELRQCDLMEASAARKALEGASVVLNLAATVAGLTYNMEHPASIFRSNLQAFCNTIQAAAEIGVDRFLVTSSACVYPRHCTIPTPEEEGFAEVPEPTNEGYGWAKRMEEFLGRAYRDELKLSVAIGRPYNAYGPRDDFEPITSHVIPALIRKAMESENGEFGVWGDGSASRSFLYVDDFARGLLEVAARYPEADPVNLGTDEETTMAELAHFVAEIVGDRRGMSVKPVFNPDQPTGQPRRHCDTRKAERLLKFEARMPLKQGLTHTVDWFAKHAYHAVYPHPQ